MAARRGALAVVSLIVSCGGSAPNAHSLNLHLEHSAELPMVTGGAAIFATADSGAVVLGYSSDDIHVVRFGADGAEKSRASYPISYFTNEVFAVSSGAGELLLYGVLQESVKLGSFELAVAKRAGFAAQLDGAGQVVWAKVYGTDSGTYGASAGTDGAVVIGGRFDTASIDFGAGPRTGNDGKANGFVAVLERSGKERWSRAFAGNPDAEVNGVALLPDGSVSVIAACYQTADLGGPVLDLHEYLNLVVAHYDRTGAFEWQHVLTGTAYAGGWDLAATEAGDTAVYGHIDSEFAVDHSARLARGDLIAVFGRDGSLRWSRSLPFDKARAPSVSGNTITFGGTLDGDIDLDGIVTVPRGMYFASMRDGVFLHATPLAPGSGAVFHGAALAPDGSFWLAAGSPPQRISLGDGTVDVTGSAPHSFVAKLSTLH